MSARWMTVLAAAMSVGFSLACTGGTEQTGPGMGPPNAAPAPAPNPGPGGPPMGGGGGGRRHGRHKAGGGGGGGGGGEGRNSPELDGAGYGENWQRDCPKCNTSPCGDVKVTASTELDGSHRSDKMLDNTPGSTWCSKDSGNGDVLTAELPAGCNLYGFQIRGGDFASQSELKGNGRVAELSVDLDGREFSAFLDDPADLSFTDATKDPASFEIPNHPGVQRVKFTVKDVYDGPSKNLCVSDLMLFAFPSK